MPNALGRREPLWTLINFKVMHIFTKREKFEPSQLLNTSLCLTGSSLTSALFFVLFYIKLGNSSKYSSVHIVVFPYCTNHFRIQTGSSLTSGQFSLFIAWIPLHRMTFDNELRII